MDMEIYNINDKKGKKQRENLTQLFLVDEYYAVSSSKRCDCDVVCDENNTCPRTATVDINAKHVQTRQTT